jgi:tetratricopeptide (TPR) repeat protein
MWPFKSSDPNKQKEAKFRELETDFNQSPEHLAMMKATWLASRGNNLGEQGKLDEAIEDFEEAIQIKPDHLPSYFSLAIAYQNKGMTEKANAILKAAPEEMIVDGKVMGTKADMLSSMS